MKQKMEIGTRVELKARTQDLSISKNFARDLGETWSRGTIAYIGGFTEDKEGKEVVMILKYTPAGNAKHQIDVYPEHIRMTAAQPMIDKKRYEKKRKTKTKKEGIKIMKTLINKPKEEEVVTTRIEALPEPTEAVAQEELTKAVTPVIDALESSATKEKNRAQHLVDLIKERKWLLKGNKVNEPILSRLGQKFRDRNQKKRIITLMNNILKASVQGVVIKEKEMLKKKIITNGHHKDVRSIADDLFEILKEERPSSNLVINETLVTRLNKKNIHKHIFADRSEKKRTVTELKKLVKRNGCIFNLATVCRTTVDEISTREDY